MILSALLTTMDNTANNKMEDLQNAKDREEDENKSENLKLDIGTIDTSPEKDDIGFMHSKIKICRALLQESSAFGLLFFSYMSLEILQSSLNFDSGLGTLSLSIIYITFELGLLFFTTLIIGKLPLKWTLFLSVLGYISYTGANFYPGYATFTISAILVGLSAGPLWNAILTNYYCNTLKQL